MLGRWKKLLISGPEGFGGCGEQTRQYSVEGEMKRSLGIVLVLGIVWVFPGWLLWQEMKGNDKGESLDGHSDFWVSGDWGEVKVERVVVGSEVVRLEGVVTSEPVQSVSIQWWQAGKYVVGAEKVQAISRGDLVEIVGKKTGRVIRGVDSKDVLVDGNISVVGNRRTWWGEWQNQVKEKVADLQKYLAGVLVKYLPEPHGSLLVGILLGIRAKLPDDFYEALVNTGTLHVIAASGFNITIVARVMMEGLGRWLPKRWALVLAGGGVVVYAVIAGANPPVVRATVMGLLTYAAAFLGKQYWASWSLVVSSGMMLLIWPSMFTSVSFWLSVAATGGILWGSPGIEKGIDRWVGKLTGWVVEAHGEFEEIKWVRKLWEAVKIDLVTTISAQLGTMPIVLAVFGRVSVASPLVNVLILWLVAPIMFGGAVKLGVGMVWGWGSYLVGMGVYGLLWMFVEVIELFDRWKWVSIEIDLADMRDIYKLGGGLAYYVLVWWWVHKLERNKMVGKEKVEKLVM